MFKFRQCCCYLAYRYSLLNDDLLSDYWELWHHWTNIVRAGSASYGCCSTPSPHGPRIKIWVHPHLGQLCALQLLPFSYLPHLCPFGTPHCPASSLHCLNQYSAPSALMSQGESGQHSTGFETTTAGANIGNINVDWLIKHKLYIILRQNAASEVSLDPCMKHLEGTVAQWLNNLDNRP